MSDVGGPALFGRRPAVAGVSFPGGSARHSPRRQVCKRGAPVSGSRERSCEMALTAERPSGEARASIYTCRFEGVAQQAPHDALYCDRQSMINRLSAPTDFSPRWARRHPSRNGYCDGPAYAARALSFAVVSSLENRVDMSAEGDDFPIAVGGLPGLDELVIMALFANNVVPYPSAPAMQ